MDKLITELINLVKSAAPTLWAIARQQVIVDAINSSILLVISAAIFIPSFRYMRKMFAWKGSEDFDEYRDFDGFMVGAIASGALMLIFGIAILVMYPDVIGRFINPDYYAIQSIINLVKPGK